MVTTGRLKTLGGAYLEGSWECGDPEVSKSEVRLKCYRASGSSEVLSFRIVCLLLTVLVIEFTEDLVSNDPCTA